MKKTILLVFVILISIFTNAKQRQSNFDDADFSYSGTMNGKHFVMGFYTPAMNYNHDQGYFYYVGSKTKIEFVGEDEIDENGNSRNPDVQKLYEMQNGKRIGYFIFNFGDFFLDVKKDKITGKYYDMKGKPLYDVVLTRRKR